MGKKQSPTPVKTKATLMPKRAEKVVPDGFESLKTLPIERIKLEGAGMVNTSKWGFTPEDIEKINNGAQLYITQLGKDPQPLKVDIAHDMNEIFEFNQ